MSAFYTYIKTLIPVTPQLEAALESSISRQTLSKNEILLNAREKCPFLYFITSGLLRGYYFNEDKEVTHWFARENEFATSFYAFITRERSAEFIQAIEHCEVIRINYDDLQALYHKFPETERIGRLLIEQYYIRLESRLLGLQFTSAKERYQKLLSERPELLQRVTLGQIASYLGITQETLSRIRGEK
ncbi:MAG TPA: Crp/Fnr family transcriptional regulator [Chitinophagaceae bacterium]|nr:Crp/Fnr family transcriptional regulator [Chitinophagaceae bacterium]